MKGARPLLQHRAERCLQLVLLAAEPRLIATAAGEEIKERSKMIAVNTQLLEKGLLTKDAIDLICCWNGESNCSIPPCKKSLL